jgi:hypothetical protein
MSDTDNDLDQFVAMLPRLLTEHLTPGASMDNPDQLKALRRALDGSDITNLALETVDLPNPLTWLAATVSEVAHLSPSLAFVLASRYAAQRALAAVDGESAAAEVGAAVICPATSDGVSFPDSALVADLFEPERLVLADTASRRTVVVPRGNVLNPHDARIATTGLVEARLSEIHIDGQAGVTLDESSTAVIVRDWNILMSALSLGIAEQARRISEEYAADRRQFGSPLTGFTALRSILAEMQLQIAGIRALLDQAVTEEATLEASAELWATAGPAAVDVALNAIQMHGGYGYIDEYPVSGLLRDAVSVRARGCDRRSAIATSASARLGALT